MKNPKCHILINGPKVRDWVWIHGFFTKGKKILARVRAEKDGYQNQLTMHGHVQHEGEFQYTEFYLALNNIVGGEGGFGKTNYRFEKIKTPGSETVWNAYPKWIKD